MDCGFCGVGVAFIETLYLLIASLIALASTIALGALDLILEFIEHRFFKK